MTYDRPPTDFEGLVAPFAHAAMVRELRNAIRKALPEATETVSGGLKFAQALYSIDGPNDVVCGMQPTQQGCKLFVHALRQDATGRLRLEGAGKYMRHVKFAPGSPVDAAAVQSLVEAARDATRLHRNR